MIPDTVFPACFIPAGSHHGNFHKPTFTVQRKVLFCRHPDLLADLINCISYPAPPIRVDKILNPTILPEDLAGKHVVLDILAEDTDGKRFGVEMQLQHFLHWPQRNIYVVSRALADQLQSGQHYSHLQPVIGISLLAHDLFHDWPSKATWHFTLRDSQLHKVQLDGTLQIHLIELRKADRLGQLPPALSDWIACLLHNLDEAAMNQITHPPVKDALSHLDALYSDEELRLVIQRRQQALMDEQDALAWATNDGEKRGEERGQKKGRQEGLQEGQADLLKRLLMKKFGILPHSVAQRLEQAPSEQLEDWSVNMLSAQTLDDVFR